MFTFRYRVSGSSLEYIYRVECDDFGVARIRLNNFLCNCFPKRGFKVL